MLAGRSSGRFPDLPDDLFVSGDGKIFPRKRARKVTMVGWDTEVVEEVEKKVSGYEKNTSDS